MKSQQFQRGAAAVELGILLIPLILFTFGVTEFGRAIYQYNTLLKATEMPLGFYLDKALAIQLMLR